MSNFDSILLELGVTQPPENKNGFGWITVKALDARKMTGLMLARGARFVTMNGLQIDGSEEIRIDYHWDLRGELLTLTTQTVNGKIDDITDICPAADWIEREIHEHLAVEFEGADPSKLPLFLKHGEEPGTLLRKTRAL